MPILDTLHIERAAILGHSSGGPSAAHFAARRPDRTTALFLDASVLLPFKTPIGALRRTTHESSFLVWLSYQIASRKPEPMTRLMIDGASSGLTKPKKQAAAAWITSDTTRRQSIQEQWASIAPHKYRKPGQTNDEANEADLAPLPFADITAPTLIAQGTNEGIVPLEHATNAASKIAGAHLVLVEEGHHIVSASRNYGPVAERQLELAG